MDDFNKSDNYLEIPNIEDDVQVNQGVSKKQKRIFLFLGAITLSFFFGMIIMFFIFRGAGYKSPSDDPEKPDIEVTSEPTKTPEETSVPTEPTDRPDIRPTDPNPTNPAQTVVPSPVPVATKPFVMSVSFFPNSNPSRFVSVIAPESSILTKGENDNLPAEILNLPDGSRLIFNISYGGPFYTIPTENIHPDPISSKHEVFRYNYGDDITYAEVKTVDTCTNSDGIVETPCTSGNYNGIHIYCETSDIDNSLCDSVISTIEPVSGGVVP